MCVCKYIYIYQLTIKGEWLFTTCPVIRTGHLSTSDHKVLYSMKFKLVRNQNLSQLNALITKRREDYSHHSFNIFHSCQYLKVCCEKMEQCPLWVENFLIKKILQARKKCKSNVLKTWREEVYHQRIITLKSEMINLINFNSVLLI